jgi:hypothetical protein
LKRIGIALLSTRPVFRSAWHFATAGAIFQRPIHSSAIDVSPASRAELTFPNVVSFQLMFHPLRGLSLRSPMLFRFY